MEVNQRATTAQITTLRSRKWTAGAVAMLLGASLVLAACGDMGGGGTGSDQAATPAGDTTAVTPAAGTGTTPEAEATEAEATEAEATVETETDVVTDTEATTEEVVITDTA